MLSLGMFYPLDAHACVPIPLNPRDKTILATGERGLPDVSSMLICGRAAGPHLGDGGVQTAWVSMYHIRAPKAR